MKKEEAKMIAVQKSKVVIETIELILTDSIPVEGKMEFDSTKIEKESVCTLEIYVPKKDYERHWLMEVPTMYSTLFYEQILTDLLENFGTLEKIEISDFYTIKYDNQKNFCGLKLTNSLGSTLTLNFICKDNHFEEVQSCFLEKKKRLENDSILKKSYRIVE